ncbi:MAG: GGGtGRT protein, partial [Cellulosilyticaceae bacterium]
MPLFESYDRRINQINAVLNQYGIKDIDEAKAICDEKGVDAYNLTKSIQPIAFENACWAYVVGAAIAIKKGCT